MTALPLRRARTWWLYCWGAVAVVLIAAAFFLPFRWWAVAVFAGFGSFEAVGLWSQKHGDRYPPLTDVIRCYVPRWACLAAMWALLAAAGSKWGVGWTHSLRVAAWFGVVGWLTNHFLQRYDGPASD